MKNSNGIRKLLAWALCLAMLAGLTALPILAAPDEGDAPAAPAAETSTQEEAPVREEAPAPAPDDGPAEAPDEGPAEAPDEGPADTPAEAPTGDNDEPADGPDKEAPADEAPAEEPAEDADAQTPADAPAEDEDEQTPADEPSVAEPADEETPAATEDEPAGDDEEPVGPAASPISRPGTAAGAVAPADEAEDEDADEPSAVSEDEEAAEAAGFAIDWAGEDVQDNGWGGRVGAVQVDEGCYLYFELNDDTWSNLALYAVAPPDRDYWAAAVSFAFYNDDPTCLKDNKHQNAVWGDGVEVRTYTSGGKRHVEAFVPNDLLPDETFAFVSNEARFVMDPPVRDAVYNGIVIDGQFRDWAALPRYDIDDFQDGADIDQFSIVWDGAYIYIYFVEYGVEEDWARTGDWRGVVASGPHHNGQFAILTDLGRRLLIQPVARDGVPSIAGIDGAMVAVNNTNYGEAPHMWEIAIPTSALPEYVESFDFGYYLVEPAITGVTDLQGGQGVDPFGQNVVIDGKYDDWVGYPHEIIEYDTPGNPFHVPDGEGALWSDDGWLYGHVSTQHPDHLAERGSEYLAAIDIVFNGNGDPENDDTYDFKEYPRLGNFYPRILAIDASGGVADFYETLNEGHSLDNGTYTFYIFDTRTDPIKQFGHTDEAGVWHDADAAALIENAFGTMKITVNGVKDEMEFCLDLEKVAAYIGGDADSFRSIDAHFGRIGPQWIRTAGTSTGPVLLALLAAGAVAAPMGAAELRRRQARRRAERDGADEGGEK